MDLNNKARKLGKSYFFDLLSDIGIDSNPNKNPRINKYNFNVINLGTLKKPVPTAVLEKPVFFDDSSRRTQILNEAITLNGDEKYYQCVTNFKTFSYGDYSYFAPFKINFDIKKTNFFTPIFNKPVIYGRNINLDTPFVRLTVPSVLSNTNFITGTNSTYNGAIVENVINSEIYISGYDSGINYAKRNTFLYTGISGLSGYLPYPQTVTSWSYPKFNIDSVLSMNSLFTYVNNENDMKGLLVISTGNENKINIVYVSPHGVSRTTGYTVIETVDKELSKLQSSVADSPRRYVYKKVSSGINVVFLDTDSSYFNNGPIFESGISITNSGKLLKGHIRQTTPLKDTIFYKLYNSFYSGNKTINTGTWDGVIPANTNFTIEYITTKNQFVGTNNEFKLFYKNYGDNSYIDKSLKSGFLVNKTIFNAYGYAISNDEYSSIIESNNNLRRSMNRKYNEFTKNINLLIYDYNFPITTNTSGGGTTISYQYKEVKLMPNNYKYNSFSKFISGLNS